MTETHDDRQQTAPRVSGTGMSPAATLAILAILLAALGLRVGYVLTIEREFLFPQGDEQQYFKTAQNFLGGHGLILDSDNEIQRAPGYPLFLTVILKISPDLKLIRLVQALVGTLTVGLVFALTRELAGTRSGLIAAALATVYPFLIYFTGLILSETLFLFLFLTSFYCLIRSWKTLGTGSDTTQWLGFCLVAGLSAAFAVLTRPEVLPVFCLVPAVWLIVGPKRLKGFAVSLALVASMFVGLSPWAARNYKRTQFTEVDRRGVSRTTSGHMVFTTLKVGESLYEAVGPFATGGPAKDKMRGPFPQLAGRNEYQVNRWMLERSLGYLKNNPKRSLRLAAIKFRRTWNVVPNWTGAQGPFHRTVSIVSCVPVLLTALIGFFVMGVRRLRALVWIMLPIVVLTLVHMVFVGSVRYRLSMIPFVIILSGVGVSFLAEKCFGRPAEPSEESAPTDV